MHFHKNNGVTHISEGFKDDAPEQATVLVVDDSQPVVALLQKLLTSAGHTCQTALSAEEAQERLQERSFDLVLSDLNMPGKSGIELIEDISKNHPETATILVTGEDDPELGRLAFRLGAFGYVVKPFNNTQLIINVTNALIRRKLTIENRNYQNKLEQAVLNNTKELLNTIYRLELTQKKVRLSQEETIYRLAKAAEFRDNETAMHIQRMSRYCEMLANHAGLDDERVELIRTASPMHDIGKIGINDLILLKAGKLTEEEYEVMKRHPEIGCRILSGSESELLNLGATIALTHHEKYDGTGYPKGIAGEDIPLEGRITAIGDVFDALTTKRVYKPAYSIDKTIEMMKDWRGTHFDPWLLDLFIDNMPDVLTIKSFYADK